MTLGRILDTILGPEMLREPRQDSRHGSGFWNGSCSMQNSSLIRQHEGQVLLPISENHDCLSVCSIIRSCLSDYTPLPQSLMRRARREDGPRLFRLSAGPGTTLHPPT